MEVREAVGFEFKKGKKGVRVFVRLWRELLSPAKTKKGDSIASSCSLNPKTASGVGGVGGGGVYSRLAKPH